ncbi:hypothetical protein [Phaeocystidibacter luteus]|uniref:Uncharacterized protein n=1 Tax=Phaeocystidibacter luteus TaxID=911197 RepID=A0A6N6RGA2_9FLAO|nr:hypothetical protein [Phaeocystidibacter luteus]KAB2810118.1 hypothetical protein F8C67_07735 [Phaeocystidibacter luteus]
MLKKAIISTAVFSLLLGAAHAWIIYNEEKIGFTFLWLYALLFVLTAGLFAMLNFVKGYDERKMGLAFIAGSPMKMLISLVFLIPFILNAGDDARLYAIHFMVPYFLYFAIELYWVFKLLRSK